MSRDESVHDLLFHAERAFGQQPAVVDGAARYTYAELGLRVRRLATALRSADLEPGDVVACLTLNSHRMMEAFFAASWAGLAIAPLNTRLAPAETAFILKDSGAKLLLIGQAFLPQIDRLVADLPTPPRIVVLDGPKGTTGDGRLRWFGYEQWIAESEPWTHAPATWPDDQMFLLCYTGGTTGLPKGVMLSQPNVMSNAKHAIQMMDLTAADRWLHAAPMFHLADAWACFSITALGGLHVFLERFDPTAALTLIEHERITATSIVPTMVMLLLNDPTLAGRDLASLRRMLYGASPMPVAPLQAAIARFGPILQQAYGQTESAPFLASMPAEDLAFPSTETGLKRLASCGRALSGIELRIARPDGADCSAGEVGEILARGPNVMLGYWRRPEETQAALAGGWLHTGDLATCDTEGYLFIVDRAKDVIISGGENIFSTEVENALYRHPAVLEAAVVGIPDERWGERVKAIVVMRPEMQTHEEELIQHCQGLIARYKCPRTIEFRDALPKSAAGKILKGELRKEART